MTKQSGSGVKSIARLLAMALLSFGPLPLAPAVEKIPIVYSTDLLHPHDDPDDHYDLATLFALEELDLRGIILDLGERQTERMGRPPLEQMKHITGRSVPYAVGLSRKLRSRTDNALDEPQDFQGGVELLLSALRNCPDKVTIFTVGSCRDVAAAWNRDCELMKQKVRAVYVNAGNGSHGPQWEHNVRLDEEAYFRLFESGLPLYWCPCFGAGQDARPEERLGRETYATFYVADQAEVIGECIPAVRNFFVYCLTRSPADPIAYLESGPHSLPTGKRNMWCTAVFFHAAGREIYRRGPSDFVALSPRQAEAAGLKDQMVNVYRFVPVRAVRQEAVPTEAPVGTAGGIRFQYGGQREDRVGTHRLEPDGKQDCSVRLQGLDPSKELRNVVVTGPREGRWEMQETGRWWPVAVERSGEQADCWFSFWAAGSHRLELTFEDGSMAAVAFEVSAPPVSSLSVQLQPAEPNAYLFQVTDEHYSEILASALKNLLAGLGRDM